MTVTCGQLEDKFRTQLGATHVDVVDLSDGCGSKFKAVIVSPQFEGKPLLQRHRLVNATIEEEMKIIHAFEMKTWTPEQWEKQRNNDG